MPMIGTRKFIKDVGRCNGYVHGRLTISLIRRELKDYILTADGAMEALKQRQHLAIVTHTYSQLIRPHENASQMRLDRFIRGNMIDEKGVGAQPNLH